MSSQQQGMKNNLVSPTPGSDELLDIVDAEDRVIGVRWRSQLYRDEACNFRVINAFLKNRQGKLWIPRRSAEKRIFPLCPDMSLGICLNEASRKKQTIDQKKMLPNAAPCQCQRRNIMTKFNHCPNCKTTVQGGWFGAAYKIIYECKKCRVLYCHRCGGSRCRDCGSKQRVEAGRNFAKS